MSRNFHTLHVHVGDDAGSASRDLVLKAIQQRLARDGFERVARASAADRVVRVSKNRRGWVTIHDDGYGIADLAASVARSTGRATLEAYCEASAFVWLELRTRGRTVGRWTDAGAGEEPSAKVVEPLLARGTAANLAAAWTEARKQIFPEAALSIAARAFGLDTDLVFGEKAPRGSVIALRRKRSPWKPARADGPPAFEVGLGSNQGWRGAHLLFAPCELSYRALVQSIGGAGRGVRIQLGGSAIERGLLKVARASAAWGGDPRRSLALTLAPDGDSFIDPKAAVPSGIANPPDLWHLGQREAARARTIMNATELYLDLTLQTIATGEGTLRIEVTSGDGPAGVGALNLMVMPQPVRPDAREAVAP